jgi:hypothetical protein
MVLHPGSCRPEHWSTLCHYFATDASAGGEQTIDCRVNIQSSFSYAAVAGHAAFDEVLSYGYTPLGQGQKTAFQRNSK